MKGEVKRAKHWNKVSNEKAAREVKEFFIEELNKNFIELPKDCDIKDRGNAPYQFSSEEEILALLPKNPKAIFWVNREYITDEMWRIVVANDVRFGHVWTHEANRMEREAWRNLDAFEALTFPLEED